MQVNFKTSFLPVECEVVIPRKGEFVQINPICSSLLRHNWKFDSYAYSDFRTAYKAMLECDDVFFREGFYSIQHFFDDVYVQTEYANSNKLLKYAEIDLESKSSHLLGFGIALGITSQELLYSNSGKHYNLKNLEKEVVTSIIKQSQKSKEHGRRPCIKMNLMVNWFHKSTKDIILLKFPYYFINLKIKNDVLFAVSRNSIPTTTKTTTNKTIPSILTVL